MIIMGMSVIDFDYSDIYYSNGRYHVDSGRDNYPVKRTPSL